MGPGGKITADPKTARGSKPTSARVDTPGTDPAQVSVKLDRETFERLDEISDATERRLAQTIRHAIRFYLAHLPEQDAADLARWRKR